MASKKQKYSHRDVILKASKALSDDYARMESHPKGEVNPSINYSKVMDALLHDDEIRGYIAKKQNKIIRAGYHWVGDDSKVDTAKKIEKETRLRKYINKMYFKGFFSGIVFVELIPSVTGDRIVDLRVHDESRIRPNMGKYGQVTSFSRKEDDGTTTNFKNETEMVVMRVDHIIDSFWTHPKIVTLYNLIRLKQLVIEHIDMLFESNHFKKHFHAKNLSGDDVKAFINLIKKGMESRDKFLVTVGTEDMSAQAIADPRELNDYINLLNHISLRMLNTLDVPPIVGGVTDGTNRSSSASQTDVTFADAIIAFQRDLEEELNSVLLPAMGIEAELRHNPINQKSAEELVKTAVLLLTNGADKKMMLEWLQSQGLDLPNGLFDKAIELEKQNQEQESGVLPQNSDLFPSRQSQEKDINTYGNGENINGTPKSE